MEKKDMVIKNKENHGLSHFCINNILCDLRVLSGDKALRSFQEA
jgi:hypothetical protein